MQPIRTVALAIVASIAVSAALAPSASAEAPEFGRCVKMAGGKFRDVGCTKAAIPGFEKTEWLPGTAAHKFTTKYLDGIPTFEAASGSKGTCKGESGSGEYTGAKTVGGLIMTFTGCEFVGVKCNSAGKPEGEISTAALEGELGIEVLGAEPVKNKLALELHATAGTDFARFTCGGLPVRWQGSILHPVSHNTMLLTSTVTFTATKAEQKPDHFAGGVVDEHTLTQNTAGGPFEEFAGTMTLVMTNEEAIEASSVN
jgi:hypothetical protein